MIFALLITIFIEGSLIFLYSHLQNKPFRPLLLTSVFANLITQPLLWLALVLFFRQYMLVLIVMEFLIWLIESLIFYHIRANRLTPSIAIFLSFAINLASFGVGVFLPNSF